MSCRVFISVGAKIVHHARINEGYTMHVFIILVRDTYLSVGPGRGRTGTGRAPGTVESWSHSLPPPAPTDTQTDRHRQQTYAVYRQKDRTGASRS